MEGNSEKPSPEQLGRHRRDSMDELKKDCLFYVRTKYPVRGGQLGMLMGIPTAKATRAAKWLEKNGYIEKNKYSYPGDFSWSPVEERKVDE